MSLTPQELGQRLQQIRETCQITQEAAAKVAGVSRVTLTQIEAGNRPINTLQLEKLARLYSRNFSDLLTPSVPKKQEALAVFFRMSEQLKQKVDRSLLEPHIQLLREYTQLEALLGIQAKVKQPVKYDYLEPQTVWEAIETGQKIAEEERQRLQLGARPVPDMVELLEGQGVRVLDVRMDENISGVFMGDSEIGLSIWLNSRHHTVRHAFTLAHEYCHVLADRDRVTVISSHQTEQHLIEVRANAFSAAFLLPKAGVEEFFNSTGKTGAGRSTLSAPSYDQPAVAEQRRPSRAAEIQLYDIVHLQHHYGVSWEAALHRLHNLGFLDKGRKADLLTRRDEAAHLGDLVKLEKDSEKSKRTFYQRDLAVRFFCLAVDAYRQDFISLRKLEELLAMIGLSAAEARKFLVKANLLGRAAG